MENLNSYIKGHFTDSILVKEQILKDENLITLIKNASLEVIKAYKMVIKPCLREMVVAQQMHSTSQGNL